MAASLHIAGTSSSVLDSVFVCRRRADREACADDAGDYDIQAALRPDLDAMSDAGVPACRRGRATSAACPPAMSRLTPSGLSREWVRPDPLPSSAWKQSLRSSPQTRLRIEELQPVEEHRGALLYGSPIGVAEQAPHHMQCPEYCFWIVECAGAII